MSIASASTTVKFHELPSGNVVHNYQPGTQINGPIRSISWSKDGNWLALVPDSGPAEIVSVKDQLKLLHTVQGIEEPSCVSFQNTTKKNIAVGTKNGQVLVYDIKTRSVKKRYPRTTSMVTRVEFTAKDNHVVAACDNGEAYLYSNVTNNLSGTFKIPRSQTISALRTNPIKRNYVAAGSEEGVVAVWDINVNKNKFFIGSHKAPVTAVAFSPISSDLVVSTGMDRQFCFYDLGENKCVGSIFVENSMTAVDFSPDGKFVVMASQKGHIYLYDPKNIQEPFHSFFGHNSKIDHLAFRKCEDYETSFNISLSESVKEGTPVASSNRNRESFGYMLTPATPEPTRSTVSTDAVDSFMQALGLDQDNSESSMQSDRSAKIPDISNKNIKQKYTPTTTKSLPDRIRSESKSQLTSTPIYSIPEMEHSISPIVKPPPQEDQQICLEKIVKNNKSNSEYMEEFVKTTVKGELKIATNELKAVKDELKSDINYHSTHVLTQMRQMYLDLLMFMVKENIKTENSFNILRADLFSDVPQSQQALLEENLRLKQKILVLEEEVLTLKNNDMNKDVF